MDDTETLYDEVLDRYRQVVTTRHALGLLNWDQEVLMPDGSASVRARQTATLSGLSHDLLTDDWVADALADLASADLTDEETAVVREIRREQRRADPVPTDLMEEILGLQSEAQRAWQTAKQDDDFEAFAPTLAEVVDRHVERAERIDPDADPYAVLLSDRTPCLSLDETRRIFDRIRESLPPLIEAVEESDVTLPADSPAPDASPEVQTDLARDLLDELGYDWDRGRLDSAGFTFSYVTADDARIAADFEGENLLSNLLGVVHEFGIALYHLGLPADEYGTPLGERRSHLVYESQARFWEDHVGRSKAFWEYVLPTAAERIPALEDVTPTEAFEAVNRVRPDNPIRTDADELTYHMHVLLRFDVERQLVGGDLDVENVPARWRELSDEYLGVRPSSVAEGCLQDVHWTGGFGSFQNYTLGSVLAAQLRAAMERDLGDLDALVREGEFAPIREWLAEEIHRHGKRYPTNELVERATGEPLSADYFFDYLREKCGRLYDI